MLEKWVSTETAAEFFDVSPRTIHRYIKEKKIPARKIGRLTRMRLSDLESAMERIGRHTASNF